VSDDPVLRYLEHLRFKNLSPRTIEGRQSKLRVFRSYASASFSKKLSDLTPKDIEEYLAYRKTKIQPVSFAGEVTILRGFFQYLKKQELILQSPMDSIDPVPRWDRTPRNIPDEKQIAHLLALPDEHTYHGIRDKAILELLYSTGIRSRELLLLRVQDVDLKDSYVMILNGKGQKQRMVPLGKIAREAIELYLKVTRPHYLKNPVNTGLFLSRWGDPLREWGVHEIVKRYSAKSGHIKGASAHSLRHACALHMLKGGAPIEAVQELLGHKQLSTTQIYTRLLPQDLKLIHQKFHPRERQ